MILHHLVLEALLSRLQPRVFRALERTTGRPVLPADMRPDRLATMKHVHSRWTWTCAGAQCICRADHAATGA